MSDDLDQPRRRTRQGFVNEGTWDHEIIPAGSEMTTVPITLIKEEE